MRVQAPLPVADAGPAPVLSPEASARRLDRFELGLLALFGVFSMWVVGLDVWHAATRDLVWTGTDGYFIVDQMQYLSWIQSASQHGLIANLFVLRGTPSDYFQPAILISGILVRFGAPSWVALLVWKPVAVVGIFFATRAVAHHCLSGRWQRRTAIALGLFFGSFAIVYGSFGIVGDMMPDWLSWGYPFGLIAIALIVYALLGYGRARGAGRFAWGPGLLGALAGTLHPWQGETFVLLILGAELVRWRDLRLWWQTGQWRRLALPVGTLVLTGIPLVYYLALGHLDLSWSLARDASRHAFSFWSIVEGTGPLAIFAALGYRGRSADFFELLLRVWAPAAIVIYIFSASGLSATPLHAFNGITIPLGVLAVKGVSNSRLAAMPRRGLLATAAVLLAIVPANAYALASAHTFVDPTPGNANFITRDERAALTYLKKDPAKGGVLSTFYMGEVVPARTGRHTFTGDCLWSEPGCNPRSETVAALFDGSLSTAAARSFVAQTGARFLLAACTPRINLDRKLRPLIASVTRFGCAAVFALKPSA